MTDDLFGAGGENGFAPYGVRFRDPGSHYFSDAGDAFGEGGTRGKGFDFAMPFFGEAGIIALSLLLIGIKYCHEGKPSGVQQTWKTRTSCGKSSSVISERMTSEGLNRERVVSAIAG
jgi:hypothetical protein